MITALAVRWLFTTVFAATALWAGLPRRRRARTADAAGAAGLIPAVFCVAMCGSLIAMTWWSEPAIATRVQAAAFGCAALWFGLASVASSGQGRRPSLAPLPYALMAVAMVWMLTAMPSATGISPAEPAHGAMAQMSPAAMSPASMSASVLVVSILLAVSCAATAFWWLTRAVGPGSRVKDPALASHAAMGAGMAAMLLVML
jgi:hypothetical protein